MAELRPIASDVFEGQVSAHEIRVLEAVKGNDAWQTAREIAVKADVKDRTARQHAMTLSLFGVFDVAKLFGGYRYRMAAVLRPESVAYLARVETAKRAFGAVTAI
jgi:hypothetical protein